MSPVASGQVVMDDPTGPILTLEPLIEAIREGVTVEGWELSGLQKTTSHQFEGRWEGDSTRSAYLFFHPSAGVEHVSVDVYLDETSRGLTGNLALVVDLAPLGEVGDAGSVLASLGEASARALDRRHKRPVTLRLRVSDAGEPVEQADTEVRFKVRIPRRTMGAGHDAMVVFAREAMHGFARLISTPELHLFLRAGDREG